MSNLKSNHEQIISEYKDHVRIVFISRFMAAFNANRLKALLVGSPSLSFGLLSGDLVKDFIHAANYAANYELISPDTTTIPHEFRHLLDHVLSAVTNMLKKEGYTVDVQGLILKIYLLPAMEPKEFYTACAKTLYENQKSKIYSNKLGLELLDFSWSIRRVLSVYGPHQSDVFSLGDHDDEILKNEEKRNALTEILAILLDLDPHLSDATINIDLDKMQVILQKSESKH